jgi:hypothetical protein
MASMAISLPEVLDISILKMTYEPHSKSIWTVGVLFFESECYGMSTLDAGMRATHQKYLNGKCSHLPVYTLWY